jgi:glycosyltransferase involved in cell wall biosynthesis
MRLSIIIPAYNAEKYLERCVTNCETQNISHDEYEIIIVNDGSKDGTLAKANELSKRYYNIKVFTQENQGQGIARNKGLQEANGTYIWFIDSDDYIEENCLSTLLKEIKSYNVDIYGICLKARNSVSGEYHLRKPMPVPKNMVMTGIYATRHGFYPASVCTYIFRCSFLQDNNLYFVGEIKHEDVELMSRAIIFAKRVVYTEHAPYYYDYNPNSTSNNVTPDIKKKFILDDIRLASIIHDNAEKQKDKSIRELLLKRSNSIVCGTLYSLKRDENYKPLLQDALELAREKNLYPMKHNMMTWKLSLLSYFFNCEWILKN